ncbi:hypothetical protein R3P38DRAFT_3038608 [Favolaschia claudopus]|uniref:Uncharacterized protein n=1 Tax=Favolaschia claudopus TaxID=2862362 RepID=A0AAW0A920_9AGAR
MYRLFTTVLLAVSSVSAITLSSGCQSALTGVATNQEANACLSVSSLLTTVFQTNASIVPPIDNWLKQLCSSAPCSNATLSAVVTNITNGCSAELSTANSTGTSASMLTPLVEQYYSTARKIVCLTDSGTNCITQTLNNIQSILGTLSIDNIGGVVMQALGTTTLPSNVTCTNCVKEAYNVLNQDFPSTGGLLTSQLNTECGSGFTGVVQTAKTTGDNNSAKAMTLSAVLGSVVFALMAFLA